MFPASFSGGYILLLFNDMPWTKRYETSTHLLFRHAKVEVFSLQPWKQVLISSKLIYSLSKCTWIHLRFIFQTWNFPWHHRNLPGFLHSSPPIVVSSKVLLGTGLCWGSAERAAHWNGSHHRRAFMVEGWGISSVHDSIWYTYIYINIIVVYIYM